MTIPTTGKQTGVIAMGTYVTHIASILRLDLSGYEEAAEAKVLDKDVLRSWGWISYTSGMGPAFLPVYTWKTDSHGVFTMPIQCPPIDFEHDTTWRLQEAPAFVPPAAQPPPQGSPQGHQ